MGSRGIGSFVALFTYFLVARKMGDIAVAGMGLFFLGLGSWFFGIINLDINLSTIALPNLFYGIGIFFALTPLVPLSCATLSNKDLTNASGLQNLLKNTGGAIGTSIATTMIARFSQAHQAMMVEHLSYSNEAFNERVYSLSTNFSSFIDTATAQGMAYGSLYRELLTQARLWGYIETFRYFALATFLLIPLLYFLKNSTKKING